MKTIKLGKNGPQVSQIGLGCMGMSDFYGSKRQEMTKKVSQLSMQRWKQASISLTQETIMEWVTMSSC